MVQNCRLFILTKNYKSALSTIFLLVLVLGILDSQSQNLKIQGKLVDDSGQPIPFASVAIAGTNSGVTCNENGSFEINHSKPIMLEFRAIGFKTKTIELGPGQNHTIILESQNYALKELVIKPGKRDPAYTIIREAQKKRKEHLKEIKSYKSRVYVKGLQKITKNPGKIMGVKVDLGDTYDPKTGIVYLSESVSELSYLFPSKYKEKMTKSKLNFSF